MKAVVCSLVVVVQTVFFFFLGFLSLLKGESSGKAMKELNFIPTIKQNFSELYNGNSALGVFT